MNPEDAIFNDVRDNLVDALAVEPEEVTRSPDSSTTWAENHSMCWTCRFAARRNLGEESVFRNCWIPFTQALTEP